MDPTSLMSKEDDYLNTILTINIGSNIKVSHISNNLVVRFNMSCFNFVTFKTHIVSIKSNGRKL